MNMCAQNMIKNQVKPYDSNKRQYDGKIEIIKQALDKKNHC